MKPIKTGDGAGAFTTTWETVDNVWASIKPVTSTAEREEILSAQTGQTNPVKIIIRYLRTVIESDFKVQWIDKTLGLTEYEIESVEELDGGKDFHVITATRRTE